MYVLGIHDGHTATACLMKDGRILSMVSEERLLHEKEKGGFPENAIKEVLALAGVEPGDIDVVAVATITSPLLPEEFHSPGFPRNLYQKLYRFVPGRLLVGDWYVDPLVRLSSALSGRAEYISRRLEELGIRAPIRFVEHHTAHAASAYYGSGFDRALVVTLDGAGDGLSGSYYRGEGLELKRLGRISAYNSIGEFYTRVTEYLGMKPLSHEYKVMGLAPYANVDRAEKFYREKVSRLFEVKGDRILNRSGAYKKDYLRLFQKLFFKVRFDVVAYSAQRLLEDVVYGWIDNIRGGYENLAAAGGVFMNVKMNYGLLKRFQRVFVMPSSGDESTAYGAAAYVSAMEGIRPEPISHLYTGRSFSSGEIERALEDLDEGRYVVERVPEGEMEEYIADLLGEGYVVARFNGPSEWGARALGNRSILADPRNHSVISRINRAIKRRDFWMPFAPSVLADVFEDYFEVPIRSTSEKFMILAYPTREVAKRSIPAALHQHDLTGRPQVVFREDNPSYYRLIKRFMDRTGVGAVLNTSFNLHGYPIVYTPSQAIFTLQNSDLDALAIGDYMIRKK